MDDYDDCGMEPYEDDLETHELNELAQDHEGEDDMEEPEERERSPVYVVVSTAPGEGVDFFGIYQSLSALRGMVDVVFSPSSGWEPVDTHKLSGKLTEGVEKVYRIRNADPVLDERSTRLYYILESYPA